MADLVSEDVLDWLVQDELDALQEQYLNVSEGGDVEIDEAFDDDRVEMHLRCLKHHQVKRDALQRLFDTELQKMAMKMEAAIHSLDGSIRFHTENLVAFGQSLGETFKGLNGNVKRTKGRDSVKCEDEKERKKFFAWCEETGKLDTLTRLKPEERKPEKREILNFIKNEGGEVPPGIDVETSEDSYKVVLS